MPIVTVQMLEGRTDEQKERLWRKSLMLLLKQQAQVQKKSLLLLKK